MLERHHLAILREVERQGSLTAAANALCLSQSALSHAIKKLEQQLGTSLWQKEGRSLHFTQAGQYLLRLAERLLPQFEHAEEQMAQYAKGQKGILRIGMECHPCYQWLLKVVDPYLLKCPDVDVDVKQRFKFGGLGAMFAHDLDLLITPDPLYKKGLSYEPVFDYEQVLVVSKQHALAQFDMVQPEQLTNETLITYPVEQSRLDVYSQFLMPAACSPKKHKVIETTDIMLQMVAAGRGVAALPRWLVMEYADKMPLHPLKLGENGVNKQIFIGVREGDLEVDFIAAFIEVAKSLSVGL